MKKRINRFIYVLAALVLFATSCDWEPIMWDSSKTYIAFTTSSTELSEANIVDDTVSVVDTVGIAVMVTALDDAPAITVDFEIDTVGIDPSRAAIEGEEYTLLNESKTLNFPNGWGYDTIWIVSIDNDIFTGDKLFNITLTSNSEDYPFGAAVTNVVTIKDDEHPLKKWLGTYAVNAVSYGSPGDWDEAWTVTTKPDDDDINILRLNGIGGSSYSSFTDVPAVVDMEAMTITIPAGSEIGTHGAYGGPLAVFLGDEAGGIDNETDPIIGTISEDGSIHIDHIAIKFVGGINTGYVWDSFDTYWDKSEKKSKTLEKISVERPGLIKQ